MKKRGKQFRVYVISILIGLSLLPFFNTPSMAADVGTFNGFQYTTDGTSVEIVGYVGLGGDVIVPVEIWDMPVTSIAEKAFSDKTTITSIKIPNTVEHIGKKAFENCFGLTSAELPMDLPELEEYLFSNCTSLTSIEVPGGVTVIGKGAFFSCISLSSVTMHEFVTTIGDSAFYECTGLSSIKIPVSVSSIGSGVFEKTDSLTSINVADANPYFTSINGVLFDDAITTLIKYPSDKPGTSYKVPATVTTIGSVAFKDCDGLDSVSMTGSVKVIGPGAFNACYQLETITIPGVVSIGEGGFSSCMALNNLTLPRSLTSMGASAFASCRSLTSIEIPESIQNIPSNAFALCYELKTVTFHESLASIEKNAFNQCIALTSIRFPKSLASLGLNAFNGCSSLTKAVFNGNAPESESGVFSGAASGFTAYFYAGKLGWLMPTWNGYPLKMLYIVKYESNGGTVVPDQDIEAGTRLTAPSVSKPLYSLDGWFTDPDFTTKWYFDTGVVTSYLTLYARWYGPCHMTYNGNGNTGGTLPADNSTYGVGETAVVLESGNLVKSGYIFSHWNTKADGSGTSYVPGSSYPMEGFDVILYAIWDASADADLQYLAVTGGTLNPSFDSAVTSYTMSVDESVTSIKVKPTATDEEADIRVNGILIHSGSQSPALNLEMGNNTIAIEVTAPDGTTTKTYTINVTRGSIAQPEFTIVGSVSSPNLRFVDYMKDGTTYHLIRGLNPLGESVKSSMTYFSVANGTWKLYSYHYSNGTYSEVFDTDSNTAVGNLFKIEIYDNSGVLFSTYYVIMMGDLNCNGGINNTDTSVIRSHVSNIKQITDPLLLYSADINTSSSINNTDTLLIRNHVSNVSAIVQ